jgi:two-component system cell cycle response regulator
LKVLVAEDDALVRRLLETFLSRWGYEVVTALDGGRAWEILQSDAAPRLALLDWMMPVMDGVDICRAVRARQADGYTYLLLLTSRDNRQDVLDGLNAGADDYLTKPFHPEELRARLRAGERILELENNLLAAREVLQFKALHDPLTGLLNHGAILDILQKELARALRDASSIGLLLLDVDHFKRTNDLHGHLAGDQVLLEIARRMVNSVRSYDGVGRYGGEEFLIVMPSCDPPSVREKAEQLRSVIAARPIETSEGRIAVTASFGILATASWPETDVPALLRAVDAALYRAKDAGRNCVVLASPEEAAVRVSPPDSVGSAQERESHR